MKRALVAPGFALAAGRIAQLVEQLTLNQRVQGSNPCAPTNEIKGLRPSPCFTKNRLPWRGPRADPASVIHLFFLPLGGQCL